MVSMAKTLVSLFDNVVDVVIEGSLTKRWISRSVLSQVPVSKVLFISKVG
jgi:hypothetical protein